MDVFLEPRRWIAALATTGAPTDARFYFFTKDAVVTVLFDIDGTLIRTGGAGMTAITQTMNEMFQL